MSELGRELEDAFNKLEEREIYECYDCGRKYLHNELEKELTELREFKKEALEVIGFYGHARNWFNINEMSRCDQESFNKIEGKPLSGHYKCGKRARVFLEKWK